MKEIKYDPIFKKNYKERVKNNPKLKPATINAINLFLHNPFDPSLRNHELRGKMKGKRSISITYDLRIVYIEKENYYMFLDIGTHNQIYTK